MTGTEENEIGNVEKGDGVQDLETASVIVDIGQEVAKDVNAVDRSHLKLSLDVGSRPSIGMFRHPVLNILHLCNTKPCKVPYLIIISYS